MRELKHLDRKNDRILVTGAAGFIGFHLCKALLEQGFPVTGLDCINDYYAISLKQARMDLLSKYQNFVFIKEDMADAQKMEQLFRENVFHTVVNLAAQPGVRYSLINPAAYINSNLLGYYNILEQCRQTEVSHLVYASSSSVYGLNEKMPYEVSDNVDHPISLYAATKKSNELLAHSYSHLFKLPTTGLRFFTVYGPWGRPDMSPIIFAKAIYLGKPLQLFNYGDMRRDFTFIDDIIQGVLGVIDTIPKPNPKWDGNNPDPSSSPEGPFRVYNIGAGNPVHLRHFLQLMEEGLGKKAIVIEKPIQPGDVLATYAGVDALRNDTGYKPETSVEVGVGIFIDWFKEYFIDGNRPIP